MKFLYLLNAKTITIAAPIVIVIASIAMAILMGSSQNMSEIEKAAKVQRDVFIVYILFLAVTVFLSALVWITSNKYQDAIKADADSKIEVAKVEAAKANENIAPLKVRAEEALTKQMELEKQNLTLRTDLNKASEQVARLQIEAANAQRELLEVQERLKPRHLTVEQRTKLIERLKVNPGNILIWCLAGNVESCGFAKQIADILTSSGWNVEAIRDAVVMGSGSPPRGLFIEVKSEKAIPVRAVKLREALSQIGFPVLWEIKSAYSQDTVELMVGAKP